MKKNQVQSVCVCTHCNTLTAFARAICEFVALDFEALDIKLPSILEPSFCKDVQST